MDLLYNGNTVKIITEILTTLDFLLLKWKMPRKLFVSVLLKLEVLERMESTKMKSNE